MKKLLTFLLLLFVPTFVGAETLSQYLDENRLSHAVDLYIAKKLDLNTAKAICTRMLNVAKSRGIEIVINNSKYNISNYRPTIEDCNDTKVVNVLFIALESAERLNLQPKYHDCKELAKIQVAEAAVKNYFSFNREYKTLGQPDIKCAEQHCVSNQKVTVERSLFYPAGTQGYVVSCVNVFDLKYHTTVDGSCASKGSNSIPYTRMFDSPLSLSDFDKDCNYLH